jgi:hypothetical protein
MRRLLPRTVSALAICTLMLAACSATGASVDATAAGAAQESGRTLTADQLISAGLSGSQWPKDIAALTTSGLAWQAPRAPGPLPRVPAACQPLVDLRWETSGASAEVVMGFGRHNDALIGEVDLASYPRGRASAFFASVRRAVGACAGFSYSDDYRTYDEKIVPLQGPHLGDETITFGMRVDVRGTKYLDRFDYVRVGAARPKGPSRYLHLPRPRLSGCLHS